MTRIQAGFPPVKGCRLDLSADLTAVNATSGFTVPFDQELFDTDGFHDNVTNNGRITIPAKYNGFYADLVASARLADFDVDTFAGLLIQHFDSANNPLETWGISRTDIAASNISDLNAVAQNVLLTTGDYFVLGVISESDTSITIRSDGTTRRTSFSLRIIGQ